MKKIKIDYLSTLFVGIDIGSHTNVISALNFDQDFLIKTRPSSLAWNPLAFTVSISPITSPPSKSWSLFPQGSTASTPIRSNNTKNPLTLLARMMALIPLSSLILQWSSASILNPGVVQYFALQQLTRHRLHITECITRKKVYMLNNIFLKFSEFVILNKNEYPFFDKYGATAEAVLTDYLSTENLVDAFVDELVAFICGRISNPKQITYLLQKAVKGLNSTEYQILTSVPDIGPVYAIWILAKLGTIKCFKNNNAITKYYSII